MIVEAFYELDKITVGLDEAEDGALFFQVGRENDGSKNWQRLQVWLDEGNEIQPQTVSTEQLAIDNRRTAYPPVIEQLDYIYHNGVEAWKTDIIQPIKDKYPKSSN